MSRFVLNVIIDYITPYGINDLLKHFMKCCWICIKKKYRVFPELTTYREYI